MKSRFCGNVYVIQCVGRLILGDEVKSLEAAFELGARETPRLVLDLSEVNRLDSIAMGLLVRYADRMGKQGGGLRLAAAPPFVMTLLNLTKLTGLLQNYQTEEEAILSFLRERSDEEAQERSGPRVIFVDDSADLCVFVKTVLMKQGYDVITTPYLRDAKILLQGQDVDYILVGPGTAEQPSETVTSTLTALAPEAQPLRMDAEFECRDANEATEALMQLLRASGSGARVD